MKKQILLAAVSAGVALASSAAKAQSIDYGAMEQLFNEPVTTSATGSPQRATEAPADMQIISADEIRRSGETSIPGILQRVAGVDVLNASAGQSDVNVRGYNQISSPRLLVLVNGRQVYLDHYGMTVWNAIGVQMDEIRQIEVVKGPGSALFGFNAVSGVVNIVTFNPKYDDRDVATVRVGTHGQKEVSLVSTFKLGQAISARLSGAASERDEWSPTGTTLAAYKHGPQRVSAGVDVVAQLAPKTELRVEGSWVNLQEALLAGFGYNYAKTVTTSEKATLTSDTRFGQIQAQAYQNQLSAKFLAADGIYWNNAITVASLQDLFKIGAAHTIRISGEYRHNTLNVQPVESGDISYDVWSGSAMWNWAITDKLTTTAAVRYDNLQLKRTGTFPARQPAADNRYWDRQIKEPSLNFTAAWKPTQSDTVRASFARGVQAPSLFELGALLVEAGPMYIQGNPKLKATTLTNTELAYDHTFKTTKVGLRLFLQDWKNLKGNFDMSQPDYLPTATTNLGFMPANVGGSKMKGIELTASGKLAGGFGWRGDYTYTDVKDSLAPGMNAVTRYVAFQSTTPKTRGNIGVDWVKGPWEADANLHYVGNYKFYDLVANSGMVSVKGYASLSSRVGYRMDNGVTFAVSGQNLLTKRQNQVGALRAERQLVFTVTKAW